METGCIPVLTYKPTQLVPLDGGSLNLWGTTHLYEGPFMHKA